MPEDVADFCCQLSLRHYPSHALRTMVILCILVEVLPVLDCTPFDALCYSLYASRSQKPPYSKRKWSIPVGNFRSAVVHAILTGLAFLLYWQRMWRIRWLPLDGSVPCFTAMASSVCREGCSRFRYFKCIISLFLRVRASLYDCSIYRNGETM